MPLESVLWTQKHAPQTLEAFVGNSDLVTEARNWALEWDQKGNGKPLLLFGQSGAGKTLLAYLLAKEFSWEIFELNASDVRNKETVLRVVGAATANASFSGKKRLVLLDEIDGIQSREDRGGMSAVLTVLKETKNPVVLTANDIYENRSMAEIRNYCKKLEFKKANYLSVAKFLREICEQEGVDYDQESLQLLAKNAGGDLRAALVDLQTIVMENRKITLSDVEALGFRERPDRIFATVQRVFRARTVAQAQAARDSSDAAPDFLARWIEENIPLEFKDLSERSDAFAALSRSDIFTGRIMRRQHWGFLRYSTVLMTAGVALAHRHPRHEFIMYKFPAMLRSLSASSSARAAQKTLAQKIGSATHSSARRVMAHDWPYLQMAFESKPAAVRLSAGLDLTQDEIALVRDMSAQSKTVAEIAQAASVLRMQSLAAKRGQSVFATPVVESDETKPSAKSARQKPRPVKDSQQKLF